MTDQVYQVIEAYGSKTVTLRFKGVDIQLYLSHGLFSSYDVDTGTRLLLRVLSYYIDEIAAHSKPFPSYILDAGSGTGVIGVALGSYFKTIGWDNFQIRAEDRDELARQFTACNGRANGLEAPNLTAHTEALLYDGGPYDWIISNIPAKAGLPVLEYFVGRSLTILKNQGRVFVVIVEKLAPLFKEWILQYGAEIIEETQGSEHRVFVYGKATENNSAERHPQAIEDFSWAPYIRHRGTYQLINIEYELESFHGVADFDHPHFLNQLMAPLSVKLKDRLFRLLTNTIPSSVLFFECSQGHFPLWFITWLDQTCPGIAIKTLIAGRNVLALEAAKQNMPSDNPPEIVGAIDPKLSAMEILNAGKGPFTLLFLFPNVVPKTNRWNAYWSGLDTLMAKESIAVIGLTATEGERFDKSKAKGFQRLGEIKRQGYRVLAYQKL